MTNSDLARALLELTHTAKTDAPATDTPIATLLADSKRLHLAYRDAQRHQQDAEARSALTDAATARARAELADPDHADPAWQSEGGTHARGLASHGELHPALLRFYLDWLQR